MADDDTNPYAKYKDPNYKSAPATTRAAPTGEPNPYAKYKAPGYQPPPETTQRYDQAPPTGGTKGGAMATGAGYGIGDLYFGGAQLGAREMDAEQDAYSAWAPASWSQPKPEPLTPTVDKTVKEREKRYEAEPSVRAHPDWAYWGGRLPGQAIAQTASAPELAALPGLGETLPVRALLAGISGGTMAGTLPTTDTDHWLHDQATKILEGAAGGAVLEPVGEFVGAGLAKGLKLVYRGGKWLFSNEPERAATTAARTAEKEKQYAAKAQTKIQKSVTQSQEAGRMNTDDVLKQFEEARESGQPFALMDVGQEEGKGGPIQRLAGSAYRGPGTGGATMGKFQAQRMTERDPETQAPAQNLRIWTMLSNTLKTPPARQLALHLAAKRTASGPLWNKAMEGGSMAPLATQFQNEWNIAGRAEKEAGARLTQAKEQMKNAIAQEHRAYDNVYMVNSAREEQAKAQEAINKAAKEQATAQVDKDHAWQLMQNAHQDADFVAAGQKKGATWSPQIQRLLGNPRVQQGLKLGLQIERDKADAAGSRFDPTEYAITGTDQSGDPIVSKVPNMKLLQMAKQGIDQTLEQPEMRDPWTRKLTKPGLAVNDLRKSLVGEMKRLNPDYEPALNAWAEPTHLNSLIEDGKGAMRRPTKTNDGLSLEDFVEKWHELGPEEREAFKTGVLDTMKEELDYARAGDQTLKLTEVQTPEQRLKLKYMFDSPAEFDRAMRFIDREHAGYQAGTSIMGGSQTAERGEADKTSRAMSVAEHMTHAAIKFKAFHPLGAIGSFARGMGEALRTNESHVNTAIAKMLTDKNITLRVNPKGELEVGPLPSPKPKRIGNRISGAAAGDIGALAAPQVLDQNQNQ
jgi:hypothetical protein